MRNGYVTLIGFILFILGFLSLLFSLVGLRFSFMRPLYNLGIGTASLIFIIMLFGGIVVMYISRMPLEED